MADNGAVGGLYVSVGLDAKPALAAANALQMKMLKLSATINDMNKMTDLSRLTKQFDDVAKAADKAAAASAKAAGSVSKSAKTGSGAVVADSSKAKEQQIKIDSEVLAQKLKLNQVFLDRISKLQLTSTLAATQAVELAAQRELAVKARVALMAGKLTEAEYNKKISLITANVNVIEKAANAEIRAQQRVTAAYAQQTTVIGALTGRSQNLLIGLGAFRSGNFFYGAAAVGGYFKSMFDGLKNVKSAAGPATGALEGLAGAAAKGGMPIQAAAGGLVALKVAAIAAAAAVPLVGLALTAVGAKIAAEGLSAAADFEMLRIQYEGLLGSADAARREVDYVLKLGTTSIVPTEQLLDANRLLLAFGVNNEAARNSLLEYISAFSSVTGASLTQVQNLSYAIGQINAAGKANAIDLRQLANAGVSQQSIFENIAKQQNISVEAAKKLSEEGKLYANVILPAILGSSEKLKAAEDKARESARGILLNLKDIAKINLGLAFESLLTSLKPILKWVETFIKAFDFKVVAKAWMQVVGYFKQGFGNITGDAAESSKSIAVTIAKAVNLIGFLAVKAAQAAVAVFNSAMVGINFAWAGIQQIIAGALYAISAVLETAAQIPGPWQATARSVADSSWLMAEESSKGAAIASDAWVNGAGAASSAWGNFFTNTPKFMSIDALSNLGAEGPKGKIPKNPDPVWTLPVPEDLGGGEKASQKIQDYLDRILELLKKASAAGKDLGEALTLPFAAAIKAGGASVKTAAEEAFSSMSIDTIVGKFEDLRSSITDYYAPMVDAEAAGSKALVKKAKAQRNGIISGLREQTSELVRLASDSMRLADQLEKAQETFDKVAEGFAKSRENLTTQFTARQKVVAKQFDDYYTATSATEGKFTKGAITLAQEALDAATRAYEVAQEKLDALREARNSFLQSLTDSVKSFVNNLSNISKEIQTYTRLDDFGSFAMTTSTEANLDSFKKSLQDRLDALKKWRVQVADLMTRGLDSDFLQSLVAAGPEASKDAIAALAGASDAELADFNRIQSDLASEISSLTSSASAQWFDAGIAAQEAFTAPLKSAYEAAQKQVADLTAQKDLALGVLNAWYAEQNELIDAQEAAAKAEFDATAADLNAKITANQTKSSEIATAINGIWSKLPGKAYLGGVNTMISLIEGLKSKEGALKAEADRIATILENTIKKALSINSPSRVMESIGEDTVDGLILGMQKSGALLDTTLDLSAFTTAASTLPVAPAVTQQSTEVRVFIGDKELTDIVDVQIAESNETNTNLVIAGRRY
jgi:tape measure domain-containing protein